MSEFEAPPTSSSSPSVTSSTSRLDFDAAHTCTVVVMKSASLLRHLSNIIIVTLIRTVART